MDKSQGPIKFIDIAYHRQQDLQIVITITCPQHGTDLGQEYLGVIQQQADAAPAEKRVRFLEGVVGQYLIAADIKDAQRYRPRRIGLDNFPVERTLLLLAGKPVPAHEQQFRPVQADAFGAHIKSGGISRHQTGIGV